MTRPAGHGSPLRFDEVYQAVHDRPPFPWQARLAREVLAHGWPGVLDLPTGAGKTTALDIALYCLACAPDRMPRRTVLVVDRRIVVDQGADHARALQKRLRAATGGPLAELAARLRALWGGPDDEPPFAVAVMRGGMPRDNDWARRPDQPVLGVSTVDQLGSRLLFRGYGVTDKSAPIHAGLVGNDTLILLDEVHLAHAFAETLTRITTRFRAARPVLPSRFMFTQMSATVRPSSSSSSSPSSSPSSSSPSPSHRFALEADDRAHPGLARRLSASKLARLRPVKVAGDEPRKLETIARHAVDEAIALQAAGAPVVAIVVNRVETARLARRMLVPHATTDAELVTGRMRPIERDHLVHERLMPRAGGTRDRSPGASAAARALVVVATQCIEAGADFDFDALVTECASLDALRQRFGRVDRRGDLVTTRSVILGRSDHITEGFDDPVYGQALAATWNWLTQQATNDTIDLGIEALDPALKATSPDELRLLLSPSPEVPVLLPAHLDAWAQTSQPPLADPDVALWLHGKTRPGADVRVIWRAGAALAAIEAEKAAAEKAAAEKASAEKVEQLVEQLIERLHACRPSALEAVAIPLAAARRWLARLAALPLTADDLIADVEGARAGDAPLPRQAPTKPILALRWRGDDSEVVAPDELRPDDVLIVDAEEGGLRDGSFDPTSATPVIDLGDLAQLRGRGIAILRLDRSALAAWQLPATMLDAVDALPDDPEDRNEWLDTWLAQWPDAVPGSFLGTPEEWQDARERLRGPRRIVAIGDDRFAQWTIIAKAPRSRTAEISDAVTEDDASPFTGTGTPLAIHSKDVRTWAERFARALGFDEDRITDLRLAGWLHDIGKADPRFQRMLHGGDEITAAAADQLLAKSAAPGDTRARRIAQRRSGYPAGCRHELLSLAMAQHHDAVLHGAKDPDLVLHLIASHHGWCRPFPPAFVDETHLPVRLPHGDDVFAAPTDHALARLDSGVAPRFWTLVERYGWWGLAWLEAVIRLADHRASEQPGALP